MTAETRHQERVISIPTNGNLNAIEKMDELLTRTFRGVHGC
jgi:hypothetical protein